MLPASPHSASLHMKIYPACNGSVIIVDYTSFLFIGYNLIMIYFPHSSGNFTTLSTSLQLFIPTLSPCSRHVLAQKHYSLKHTTAKMRRITYTSAAIIVYRISLSSVPVRTAFWFLRVNRKTGSRGSIYLPWTPWTIYGSCSSVFQD